MAIRSLSGFTAVNGVLSKGGGAGKGWEPMISIDATTDYGSGGGSRIVDEGDGGGGDDGDNSDDEAIGAETRYWALALELAGFCGLAASRTRGTLGQESRGRWPPIGAERVIPLLPPAPWNAESGRRTGGAPELWWRGRDRLVHTTWVRTEYSCQESGVEPSGG